jgi:uncharacterized protein (DUF4415 family)
MKLKPNNINAADWDAVESPPLSDELMNRMRPAREVHPDRPNQVSLPSHVSGKVLVSIGLAPEIVDYFKSTGPDWQNHVDAALKEWITTHPLPSREAG